VDSEEVAVRDGEEVPGTERDGENSQPAEPAQQKPGTDPLTEKYRRADGALDTEKIFSDLQDLQKNCQGLRKKLSESAKEVAKPVTLEDLRGELGDLSGEEEKRFAEKFVGLLGKVGAGKDQAVELLRGLGELGNEDPKEFYGKELAKLGSEGETLLRDLRRFRDTVRDSGSWTKEDVNALEMATQTAEGVRLIHKILHAKDLQSVGKFSPRAPVKGESGNATLQEKIAAYEAAYALEKRDPAAARTEIRRLNKLYNGGD
jgi:hypothetical protein